MTIRTTSIARALLALALSLPCIAASQAWADTSKPTGIHQSSTAQAAPSLRCASTKQKVALRRLVEVNACVRKAAELGMPADAGCLDKADRQFRAAFENIEESGRCSPVTGDADAVAHVADTCAEEIAAALPGMCLAAGSPCGGVPVSCCSPLSCIAEIGGSATCR